MLDAGKGAVLAEPFDLVGEIALVNRIVEVEREAAGDGAARFLRDRELRHRIDGDGARRIVGALRLDVEPAQRLDRVAEQLDADGAGGVRREEIEDAAAK